MKVIRKYYVKIKVNSKEMLSLCLLVPIASRDKLADENFAGDG